MNIKINDKEFIVTNMLLIDGDNNYNKYNVFDKNYSHIVTIDAEDEIHFMEQFNNFMKNEMVSSIY